MAVASIWKKGELAFVGYLDYNTADEILKVADGTACRVVCATSSSSHPDMNLQLKKAEFKRVAKGPRSAFHQSGCVYLWVKKYARENEKTLKEMLKGLLHYAGLEGARTTFCCGIGADAQLAAGGGKNCMGVWSTKKPDSWELESTGFFVTSAETKDLE